MPADAPPVTAPKMTCGPSIAPRSVVIIGASPAASESADAVRDAVIDQAPDHISAMKNSSLPLSTPIHGTHDSDERPDDPIVCARRDGLLHEA